MFCRINVTFAAVMLVIFTIIAYFSLLFAFSRLAGGRATNDTFFRGERRSPWYMVAFGMVGASISGVTFVSVPSMVLVSGMSYLQMCLGFILGYLAVAFLLLPIYYRLNLTTIYSYLLGRLGRRSYKTGASFFLLSKMTGAAVRFYVVCLILSTIFPQVSFPLIVAVMVAFIWLYTRRGGIRTLVWTDTFQTVCMFSALILIICQVTDALGMNFSEAVRAVAADERSRIFVFDDWASRQNFWKQFLSGIFVVIVMTGLDQDMMQKNLTCKTLREAQKDMCSYGIAFVPANLLFLALGVLLALLFQKQGIALPDAPDQLLPMFVEGNASWSNSYLLVLFVLGIVASSFSSADSAMTALTTSFCVDICERKDDERLRKRVHLSVAIVFAVFILLFRLLNNTSIIDAIYILCSYTYGPLLGLFAFGLLTRRAVNDRWAPLIAVASPLVCLAIDFLSKSLLGYTFGYEMLMLNGGLTFLGLLLIPVSTKKED